MLITGTGLAAAAVTKVPLNVVEHAGESRSNEPVTAGVPLPKGALTEVKNVRLLLGDEEVPAQFRIAGRWLPDTSIKWLLVDLQATLNANEVRTYTLEYGPGSTASAKPPAAVTIAETDDAYSVTTGAATFRISKKTFTLFDEVRLGKQQVVKNTAPAATLRRLRKMVTRAIPGTNNTGRSHLVTVLSTDMAKLEDYTLTFLTGTEYEVIGAATGNQGKGVLLKDFTSRDGRISIPGNQWLRYHRPKRGDTYSFRTIPAGHSFGSEGVFATQVLEAGPIRSVIQVRGSFGPTSAPVMEFTARYQFYANSSRVKVLFTLENNDFGGRTNTGNADNCNIGGINCVFFDEMALGLPLSLERKKAACFGRDLAAAPGSYALDARHELYQDSNGGAKWNRYANKKYHPRPNSYVTFKGYKIFHDGVESGKGSRAPGWLSVTDGKSTVCVAVRDFWQNFPKALAADRNGRIEIGLFPGRYASDFPFRSGEHKTHEILLAFHPRAVDPVESARLSTALDDPLRLEPTVEWFGRTLAMEPVHPFDMTNYKAYEIRNLSFLGIFPKGVRKGASMLSRREQMDMYGWMDYGDVAMDFESGSGQWGMKYDLDYHMAQQYVRSLNPLWWKVFAQASKHHCDIDVHHQPHYPWIHYVKGGSWAHSQHNEPGNINPNRNRGRHTKDLCFGARGAATRYYFTGDWKARETVLEQADNALAQYMSPQSEPDVTRINRMGWRGDAGSLNRLLEGYLMTGNEKYLTRARWIIKDCAFDGKPSKHRATSLWSSTFYMMALARYVDLFPADEDARGWLLAHLETLYKASDRPECMMYTVTPQPDGSVTGKGQTSMYNVMGADALTIAYQLTGEKRYFDLARRLFAYGVKNACWVNGPATYYHIQSANGALHGNWFMAQDAALRGKGE
jgi:hypothetical protein